MNEFKTTDKDKAFEELIKELQPITRKSDSRDFGSASKRKSEHTLTFQYKEFTVEVQLS